nr:hypothetical protein [Tanacetum cinerariifolium]
MALTFADTHNMIVYLTKSDASEVFEQILTFLNASVIQYALTVIITEDTVRQALHLDDAKSIDCLPNEEIFAELARMGGQLGMSSVLPWLRLLSASQQAADDVANVAADDVANNGDDVVVGDAAEPSPPSPTPTTTPPPPQELLPSISQVAPTLPPSPIAQPSSPLPQQQSSQPSHDAAISVDLLNTLLETYTTLTRKVEALEQDKIAQPLEITKLKQRVRRLEKKNKLKVFGLRRLKKVGTAQRVESSTDTEVDAEKDVEVAKKDVVVQGRQEESQAQVYHIDLEHVDKVLSMQDDEPEPAELKEVIEVVTTAKLITEVVTVAATTITVAPITAATIIAAPSAVKRKEKEDNAVLRYQALKRKPQTKAQARKNMMVYLKNMAGFKMDFFKGMSYDDIRPIFEKHFNSIVGFLNKGEEQLEEEASRALKRKSKSSKQQVAKKQKFDEEVEELEKHLQIVPNDEYDVYIKATPLALKNFSDDFLLTTLKAILKKPDVEAHIWKNQRGSYGLAKVKSWKLLKSCGVHIITFTTTHMILLVERRYPLTKFTLEQMLNNVRLEVEEESEVSLELLRFVRRQQQEGYRPE